MGFTVGLYQGYAADILCKPVPGSQAVVYLLTRGLLVPDLRGQPGNMGQPQTALKSRAQNDLRKKKLGSGASSEGTLLQLRAGEVILRGTQITQSNAGFRFQVGLWYVWR